MNLHNTPISARGLASANQGIRLDMQPEGSGVESDVQAQITRLSRQVDSISYVVDELSGRLGPLLFPEMLKDASVKNDVVAPPLAGTPLAQVISNSTDRLAVVTRNLNDLQNRLGI